MMDGQFKGIAPWHQAAWDIRAAGNFIGGGSGTGLLILAGILAWQGQPQITLLLAGLVLVALGLFSVFLEIGRPLRSFNVLLGGKRSWMTREAFVAGVLFPLGGACLLWPGLMPWIAVPAAAYMFCQARILMAAKGIPAWREPLVLPLIVATAFAEGAGALLLLGNASWASSALLAAVAARMLAWMAYRRRLEAGGAPVMAAANAVRFSVPFVIGGNMIPLVLVVVSGLDASLTAPALAAAGLFALLGGWALKTALVTRFAYNQGYAIPRTPARGAGRPGPGVFPGWRMK